MAELQAAQGELEAAQETIKMHEEEADPYLSGSDREDLDLEEHGVTNNDDDGEGGGGKTLLLTYT